MFYNGSGKDLFTKSRHVVRGMFSVLHHLSRRVTLYFIANKNQTSIVVNKQTAYKVLYRVCKYAPILHIDCVPSSMPDTTRNVMYWGYINLVRGVLSGAIQKNRGVTFGIKSGAYKCCTQPLQKVCSSQ